MSIYGSSIYHLSLFLVLTTIVVILLRGLAQFRPSPGSSKASSAITNFLKFFYASFLKPHSIDDTNGGQQSALESFYKAQVNRLQKI